MYISYAVAIVSTESIEKFNACNAKFAAGRGNTGLTTVHDELFTTLTALSTSHRIVNELKVKDGADRVACVKVVNSAGLPLYIACEYLPDGLHKKNNVAKLKKASATPDVLIITIIVDLGSLTLSCS